jgi:PAS domain-containing protein
MLSTVAGGLELLLVAILGAGLSHMIASFLAGPGEREQALAALTARETVIPLWRESEGRIIWSNPAFRELQMRDPQFPGGRDRRETEGRWHSILRNGEVGHAVPADALVRAETDLGQMVQTMAKTFAHLPIGLAVFDRDRHLHIFNPALADLISLSPEFLSRRPSLVSILDAMRNRRMVPEPANWKEWRRSIAQMEQAASGEPYEQTWSLAGGQTYRVTGRPHPNGALALMIEDISSETIRSRRHRADLELCQGIIDTQEEGIAVFSASGRLVMSNAAYRGVWSHEPASEVAAQGIRQLSAHWRAATSPSPIWSEAEDFVATLGPRTAWQAEARLTDGRLIACRFAPLSDGATLAGFRLFPLWAPPRAVAGSA